MKKNVIIYLTLTLILPLLLISACNTNNNLTPGTNLNVKDTEVTELDKYIKDNFVTPYNIEVLYKYDESILNNPNNYHYPADVNKVKEFLEILKTTWIEPYIETTNETFIKTYSPRQLLLVGSDNRNVDSGVNQAAFAHSGARIGFFSLNINDLKDPKEIESRVKTTQHEYVHVLNQTIPFDTQAFIELAAGNYTTLWYISENTEAIAHEKGFITRYSRFNEREDFAEMCESILSRSKEQWDKHVNDTFKNEEAKRIIKEKEKIIVNYFMDSFNIDFYKLQENTYSALTKALNK